jgi:hypothetical protein
VPEHQEFGILGHPTPGQRHHAAEETAHKQVDAGEDHSAMIPARKTPAAGPDRVIEPHKIQRSTKPPQTTLDAVLALITYEAAA